MNQEINVNNNNMTDTNILNQINEGMEVRDANGKTIGRVERIFLGDVSPEEEEIGRGAATPSNVKSTPLAQTIVNELMEALSPGEEIPDVLRERLELEGFARLKGKGLLGADRFILPDQIQSVEAGRVNLKVTREELIKR
jgi:hypothetical protein